ncbi:MAG: Sua5/YciO/YrdC/YwlC family protein, partial [Eubacteriales bacterium]|nr:Sua5/YciO/YrdC/YwlC family protein [Eubacteriales bacterium]
KGIGGFHLCCDATNEEAVHSLRMRKRRPAKPFAVMMREEETVLRECLMNEEQRRILTGHQKPILLLERRKDPDAVFSRARKNGTGSGLSPDGRKKTGGSLLAPSVAPGNPRVGVMLPYTPLHMLLFRYDDGLEMPDCLIMTSGNVSGAPICRDDADVLAELSGFCDCILSHDRLIRIRADDTVMDFHRGHPYMIRRSRGYAPLPVLMSGEKLFPGGITARPETGVPEARRGDGWFPDRDPQEKGSCILAIGGELKNTFCIASGNLFYLSPYVGDLEDLRTVRALKETSARMEALLEVSPAAVVCDLHPKYNSTAVAEEMAAEKGIPLFRIQHHYAHVLSCMAENDRTDRVIGVSFDGTGYGTDGTIWGGEILLADCIGFRRAYAIRPFLQIGGDSAPRQGWRVAASMIWSLCKKQQGAPEDAAEAYFRTLEQLSLCDIQNAKAQRMMAERRIQAVSSTSAGRLFDAVSAMLGICRESTYEGEASIELQFAAERYAERKDPERAVQERAAAKRKGCIPALRKEPAAENQCPEDAVLKRDRLQTTLKKEEIPEEPRTGHDFPGNDFQENDSRGDSPEPPLRFLETDRLFAALLQEKLRGADPEKLAYDFHEKLAGMIVEACVRLSAETGIRTAALTGGCFQNRLLLSLTEAGLQEKGLEVLIHHLVPPNDGGIALGQALAGRFLLGRESAAGHGSFQI